MSAQDDENPPHPDSGSSPHLFISLADRRRQLLAKFKELRNLMSLRQLIQVQRHLMDASRNLAFTLWCSYSTEVNPNWNVQIHNCHAFFARLRHVFGTWNSIFNDGSTASSRFPPFWERLAGRGRTGLSCEFLWINVDVICSLSSLTLEAFSCSFRVCCLHWASSGQLVPFRLIVSWHSTVAVRQANKIN